MIITVQAKAQLERIALYYGVTQRELLTRVLADGERSVVDGLGRGGEKTYYQATD